MITLHHIYAYIFNENKLIFDYAFLKADSNNFLNALPVSSELECKNVCHELLGMYIIKIIYKKNFLL